MEQYVKGFLRFHAGKDVRPVTSCKFLIPSTLGVKMSSLPLSMTRKKLRGQQTTRSERSINGRSEIDFLTLKNSEEVPYNGQNLFFQLTEVAGTSVE